PAGSRGEPCPLGWQLLARIERMERRVQLVKKDSEREKHRIYQAFEVDEKPEVEACEKLPLECPQDLLEPPPTLQPKHFPHGRNGKGHKSRLCHAGASSRDGGQQLWCPPWAVPKHVSGLTLLWHEPGCHTGQGYRLCPALATCFAQQPADPTQQGVKQLPVGSWEMCPRSVPPWHSTASSGGSPTAPGLVPFLLATQCWAVCWGLGQMPPWGNSLASAPAVPSWRDHVVEPLRDPNPSDILENLDDSVFAKRHAKLELDEKRRKRWDIQRIREQRILQRLQLRMYKRKGIQESEPEVTS
ncbi:Male-specific lethal 1, partial [Dryobates pubescens]